MTALIKSTDGTGWVEARLGDKIKHPSMVFFCTIDSIEERINGTLVLKTPICGDALHQVDANSCQLVERPLRVGDKAQLLNKANGVWYDTEYCEGDAESNRTFRHSSPLLRPVGGV